jgi:NADH-quinone oxidoreductase subunit J
METAVFAIAALAALVAALVVLVHKNPVIGALFLVMNLGCIAVLFLLLNAPFLAAIQVIVYAGAIMVLIIFVIMLLNLKRETVGIRAGAVQGTLGGAGAVAFVLFVARSVRGLSGSAEVPPSFGTAEHFGARLFGTYFYPFEFVSLILLAAMAGAVVLAKKKL